MRLSTIKFKKKKGVKALITVLMLICYSGFSQKHERIGAELNTVLSSETGEAVVSAGVIIIHDAINIVETFEVKLGFYRVEHSKGRDYPFVSTKKGYRIYYSENVRKGGVYWGIGVNINNPEIIIPTQSNSFNTSLIKKPKHRIKKEKIQKTEIVNLCDNCYKQELIYSGQVGDVVKFSYREFIGDIARPSFYQELEYDVSKNNVIGFKGLRLKILETSNTEIKYEVIEDFNSLK